MTLLVTLSAHVRVNKMHRRANNHCVKEESQNLIRKTHVDISFFKLFYWFEMAANVSCLLVKVKTFCKIVLAFYDNVCP